MTDDKRQRGELTACVQKVHFSEERDDLLLTTKLTAEFTDSSLSTIDVNTSTHSNIILYILRVTVFQSVCLSSHCVAVV